MPRTSDEIRGRITNAVPEPIQSCPIIDRAQREALSLCRVLVKAAKETEENDPSNGPLNDAESFIEESRDTLEKLREINAALRERCEDLENTAYMAADAVYEYEVEVERLETANKTNTETIKGLCDRISTSWWRRLYTHAQAVFYGRRSDRLEEVTRALMGKMAKLRSQHADNIFILDQVYGYLHEMEWTRKPPERPVCSECGTQWVKFTILPPEHDEGCKLGTLTRRVRRALQETE